VSRFLPWVATALLFACTLEPRSSVEGADTTGSLDASQALDAAAGDVGPPGTRPCGSSHCTSIQICILGTDGGSCANPCSDDGGCGLGQACQHLAGDGGLRACTAAGWHGDECEPEPCTPDLVCTATEDASARCRWPCNSEAGDASLACPSGWVCFPFLDASAGACMPR
jgi:hypothetical protein